MLHVYLLVQRNLSIKDVYRTDSGYSDRSDAICRTNHSTLHSIPLRSFADFNRIAIVDTVYKFSE